MTAARRAVALVVAAALTLSLAVGYVWWRIGRLPQSAPATAGTAVDEAMDASDVLSAPHVSFRSTATGPTYGRLAMVPTANPGGDRAVGDVTCERVHAASGVTACVDADRDALTTYALTVLGADLRSKWTQPLNGLPSRVRLSDDGSLVSTTQFVVGHSYAQGSFSTETVLRDVESGQQLGNLEDWSVVIDGQVADAADLNVWGVTFARGEDPRELYATVATGGRTWLARGDIGARELQTVAPDVECPALSPDGGRVAYKQRTTLDGVTSWQLAVLDLESGAVSVLDGTRSVDDQPEWLDDEHVLYGLPREGTPETDVWVADVDGSEPVVLIPRAWSPAVVTPAVPLD